jgi:NAD(P)-dependent dehydrogenase (short-subunit alcohol dehydrogenase family)
MSSSTSTSKPSIAIFGATGGTGLAVLKNCLAAGHSVSVLVRTPSKLSSILSQYPDLLHVTQGDIHNSASIKQALVLNNRRVDMVISAIGMVLQFKGVKITSPDPTICEVGTRNIITALAELDAEADQTSSPAKPKLIIVSTTGISQKRDIPIVISPFYHYGLAVPHADKKRMEDIVINSDRSWVLVRPSFLVDGPAKGIKSVRTGTESPTHKKEAAHAIGYTIRREDVGLWIFEECVSPRGNWDKWAGKCVSLTY